MTADVERARQTTRWKYLFAPILVVTVLALYPQLSSWLTSAGVSNGSYFVSNYDEVAYSAYINSLIEGKPRRVDPFMAVDEPGYESLFSVQFVPAYAIALPARLLGMSASTAFIILSVVCAIASFLAVFWFIYGAGGNTQSAAVGALVVLCLGTAVAFQGELRLLISGRVLVDHLPFLRRFQPAIAFPFLFLFCGLVWRSFTAANTRKVIMNAVVGGFVFSGLVYSYFYLWTAAAGWLGCFVLAALILLREKRNSIFISTSVIGVFAVASLIPYFSMLAQRSPHVDATQLLTNTHAPDLGSSSLLLGLLMLAVVGFLAFRNRIDIREPRVLLACSLLITPVVLFNQQVITGRSLQPIHYEIFVANYMVLTAAILLGSIWLESEEKTSGHKLMTYIAAAATVWGLVEVAVPTSRNSLFDSIRDASVPAIQYVSRGQQTDAKPVVLATNFITADFIPTVATIRPLWNAHSGAAGGISPEENKRLFYLYLYYSGFTPEDLTNALNANSFEVTAAIFGSERALPLLGSGAAIKAAEIRDETRKFADFAQSFDANHAANPVLTDLIVPAKGEPNLANLDRWYGRDAGSTLGMFTVYRLTPR